MRLLPRTNRLRDVSAGIVCRSCRQQQQRRLASSTAPPKPPPAGLASLPSRRLLALSGPDASKFLQGIVTANVAAQDGLPRRDAFYGGFLNATGRVLHDVFIYPQVKSFAGAEDDAGFLIEVDADSLDGFGTLYQEIQAPSKSCVAEDRPWRIDRLASVGRSRW